MHKSSVNTYIQSRQLGLCKCGNNQRGLEKMTEKTYQYRPLLNFNLSRGVGFLEFLTQRRKIDIINEAVRGYIQVEFEDLLQQHYDATEKQMISDWLKLLSTEDDAV